MSGESDTGDPAQKWCCALIRLLKNVVTYHEIDRWRETETRMRIACLGRREANEKLRNRGAAMSLEE